MAEGVTVLTREQLATIGGYADVQFIWDVLKTSNLLFSVPFTDADGTAGIHPVTYINLATLFEITQGGAEQPPPGSATRVAQETHDATFTETALLTEAQYKAMKTPTIIWVIGDPLGGTDLIWTLAGEPRAWVIDLSALFDLAVGELQGHEALGQVGNGGEISRAQLDSVPRATVNFVNSGPDTSLIYTVEGSPRNFIINLSQLIHDGVQSNEIAPASHTH